MCCDQLISAICHGGRRDQWQPMGQERSPPSVATLSRLHAGGPGQGESSSRRAGHIRRQKERWGGEGVSDTMGSCVILFVWIDNILKCTREINCREEWQKRASCTSLIQGLHVLGFKPCLSKVSEKNLSNRVSKTCAFLGWVVSSDSFEVSEMCFGFCKPLVEKTDCWPNEALPAVPIT